MGSILRMRKLFAAYSASIEGAIRRRAPKGLEALAEQNQALKMR